MRKDAVTIDPGLIALGLEAENRREALEILVGGLRDKGYVDDDFLQQAIRREEEYPTGLAFPHICIAIPHASPQNVQKSACAIGRCQKPVPFRNMEEPETEIPVELICVLALKDPNDHLDMMNRLIGMFGDDEQIEKMRGAQSSEALAQVFWDDLFGEA